MEITKTKKIVISVVIVIILLALYVAFDRKSKQSDYVGSSSQSAATSTDGLIKGLIYKVEDVGQGQAGSVPKPIPDLDRVSVTPPSITLAKKDLGSAHKKIKELQTALKSNPGRFEDWMDLAMYQKLVGDYEGAVISWKYSGRLRPADYVHLGNLGNLYAYYLQDRANSEMYYKQAFTNGPTQVYLYFQLAEIYIDVYKDNVAARTVLEEGLKKIPNDPSLLQMKADLAK